MKYVNPSTFTVDVDVSSIYKFCEVCGSPLIEDVPSNVASERFNPKTGERILIIFWGCPKYSYSNNMHHSYNLIRIPESEYAKR